MGNCGKLTLQTTEEGPRLLFEGLISHLLPDCNSLGVRSFNLPFGYYLSNLQENFSKYTSSS